MKKNKYILILSLVLVLMLACGKEDNIPTSNTYESTSENDMTESVTTESSKTAIVATDNTTTASVPTTEPTTKENTDTTTETPTDVVKEDITPVMNGTIDVCSGYILGVNANGKISCVNNESWTWQGIETIGKWENLTSIAVGDYDTANFWNIVGLKADGTVYSIRYNLQSWNDVVMVAASDSDIIGLKKDGTVLSKGTSHINKDEWQDIVQVGAGNAFVVGLKKDKTVIADGSNDFGQLEVTNWTDVEMISAGYNHVVGLRTDGTVLAAGAHFLGQCDVAEWKDIVFVAAGRDFTVGVKSDGTVVATGHNVEKRCAGIENWTNIISVSIGRNCVVGVTKSGEIMVAGYPESTAVSELKDIVMPTTNYEMDFDKQLAEVKQNYIELEVKGKGYDGEVTYLEPENGILKAGQFSVKVSEDIADEICYLSYEDSIDVYYKNDFTYEYDSDKMCITYLPARLGTIQGGTDIGESIACIIPQWVIGDEAERKEVNEYIHTILKQVCTLAGKEYTYQSEVFVEEDGNVRGSDLLSLYTEYKDKLTVDERVYYTFTPPSDPQIRFVENTEEFEAIRAYFGTLAEIVDGE